MTDINDHQAIIPNHVGMVPDGTRRWAKQNHADYETAYMVGVRKTFDFIDFMFSKGVKIISIYGLSTDNLSRPQAELEKVFKSEIYAIRELLPNILKQYKIRVKHAGDIKKLPTMYAQVIEKACEITQNNTDGTLYLLAAYDAIDEIYVAAKRAENPQAVFENLWVPEKIDLLIRTSGVYRISNFLPLQAGYAELVFCEKGINDLEEKDWQSCLDQFQQRKRRFGS
jgi:undecaprenyl diphosphate synthase